MWQPKLLLSCWLWSKMLRMHFHIRGAQLVWSLYNIIGEWSMWLVTKSSKSHQWCVLLVVDKRTRIGIISEYVLAIESSSDFNLVGLYFLFLFHWSDLQPGIDLLFVNNNHKKNFDLELRWLLLGILTPPSFYFDRIVLPFGFCSLGKTYSRSWNGLIFHEQLFWKLSTS